MIYFRLLIGSARVESGKLYDKIMREKIEQKQNGSSSNNGVTVHLCFVLFCFLYIKNYSSVYKGMSALSNIENNLESVSQRG